MATGRAQRRRSQASARTSDFVRTTVPDERGPTPVTFTDADPMIGREILGGQFKILEKIGSGGMGAVYRASQHGMNRMVGVKVLHPRLKARKDLSARFRREASAMSHLTHPNTTKVFVFGELEDGALYIVMEHLEGQDLHRAVRTEGPFSLARALPILIQVCGALAEAHAAGIIHRDLKPENIFLCEQGALHDYPKVLDFGLAKVTEREMRPGSVILTKAGMILGTRAFMSPEQARGMRVTAATDIYSLALVLYEMLTGKLPFDDAGKAGHPQLDVKAQPIALSARVPGLTFPPLLDDVVARALAKRPEDRFASAADFARALEAVRDGEAVLPADLQSTARPRGTLAMPRAVAREALPRGRKPSLARPLARTSDIVERESESFIPVRAQSLGKFIGVALACLLVGAAIMTLLMTLASR